MSKVTIADKKFLSKLVNEVLIQEITPPFQPATVAHTLNANHIANVWTASEKIAHKHEQNLNKIISGLSAEAKWVFSTKPEPTRGAENLIEFQENEKMANLMSELKTLKISENEEESVNNIQQGLSSFVLAVGNADILANLDGVRWGDDDYASVAYDNLKTSYSFDGTMDSQITKMLNFRGSKHLGVSFENFYVANLNEINTADNGRAAVDYCAWKIAEEQSFKDGVSSLVLLLSMGLSLATGGTLTTLLGSKMAFIVDLLLFDVLLTEAIDFPQVEVTYQEAAAPWIELKNRLNNLESSEREEKITQPEIELYKDGKRMVTKLFQKYVGDWAAQSARGANQASKLFQKIENQVSVEKIELNLIDSEMSKDLLLQTINQELEKFRGFFVKLNNPKEITLPLMNALDVHLSQILAPSRAKGEKKPFIPQKSGTLGLQKEIKGLDSASKVYDIDVKINILLGRREEEPSTFETDIGGEGITRLASAFLSLYDDWKKYSVNLDRRPATNELKSLWDFLRRDFSSYKRRAGSDTSTNLEIHEIMSNAWRVWTSMPLGHLKYGEEGFGHDGSSGLHVGLVYSSPNQALVGSFVNTGSTLIDFAKMIKFGAIGACRTTGKIEGPMHDDAAVYKAARTAGRKARIAERIKSDLDSNMDGYELRKDFLTAYKEYYLNMSKTLEKCARGTLSSDIDATAKDLFRTFIVAKRWDRELKR